MPEPPPPPPKAPKVISIPSYDMKHFGYESGTLGSAKALGPEPGPRARVPGPEPRALGSQGFGPRAGGPGPWQIPQCQIHILAKVVVTQVWSTTRSVAPPLTPPPKAVATQASSSTAVAPKPKVVSTQAFPSYDMDHLGYESGTLVSARALGLGPRAPSPGPEPRAPGLGLPRLPARGRGPGPLANTVAPDSYPGFNLKG